MILSCSACNARFLVPDAAIGAHGRMVKCGKCGSQWFASLSGKAAPAPDIDALMRAPKAEAPLKATPIKAGSNLPVKKRRFAMPVTVVALLLIGAAAALGTLAFAPQLLGLPDSRALSFAEVEVKKKPGTETSFILTGQIRNNSDAEVPMPKARLVLLNAAGEVQGHWWLKTSKSSIGPGESAPFTQESLDVPPDIQGATLRLDMGNALELALRPLT